MLDAAEVRIGEATLLAAAAAGDDPVDVLAGGRARVDPPRGRSRRAAHRAHRRARGARVGALAGDRGAERARQPARSRCRRSPTTAGSTPRSSIRSRTCCSPRSTSSRSWSRAPTTPRPRSAGGDRGRRAAHAPAREAGVVTDALVRLGRMDTPGAHARRPVADAQPAAARRPTSRPHATRPRRTRGCVRSTGGGGSGWSTRPTACRSGSRRRITTTATGTRSTSPGSGRCRGTTGRSTPTCRCRSGACRPRCPADNPTGLYRTTFTVPEARGRADGSCSTSARPTACCTCG